MIEKTVRKLCMLGVVALLATTVAGAGNVSVGEFVVQVAQVRGIAVDSPAAAVSELRAGGWAIPELDLSAPLTEGTVVAVGRSFGIDLRTSRPDNTFTLGELDSILVTLRPSLESGSEGSMSTDGDENNGADPLTKGKGLKKGIYKRISPSEPV